jgi:hypothetical protein
MHTMIALLLALTVHAPHGHAHGWTHNHRAPVTVTVTRGVPSCTWVLTGTIGSVPHCV